MPLIGSERIMICFIDSIKLCHCQLHFFRINVGLKFIFLLTIDDLRSRCISSIPFVRTISKSVLKERQIESTTTCYAVFLANFTVTHRTILDVVVTGLIMSNVYFALRNYRLCGEERQNVSS